VLDLLGAGQKRRIDLLEPPAKAGEGAGVRLYSRAAEILEEVVVKVNAIEARLAGENLIEIGEVIVDKMREGLRWVHAVIMAGARDVSAYLRMVQ
jgi:hypothetical protein